MGFGFGGMEHALNQILWRVVTSLGLECFVLQVRVIQNGKCMEECLCVERGKRGRVSIEEIIPTSENPTVMVQN